MAVRWGLRSGAERTYNGGMVRTERFNLRLEPEEAEMLKRLSTALGVGGSGTVRMLIREAYARRFGEAPVKPPRPKRKTKR
jgi:hypothetical protein